MELSSSTPISSLASPTHSLTYDFYVSLYHIPFLLETVAERLLKRLVCSAARYTILGAPRHYSALSSPTCNYSKASGPAPMLYRVSLYLPDLRKLDGTAADISPSVQHSHYHLYLSYSFYYILVRNIRFLDTCLCPSRPDLFLFTVI